MIGRGKLWSEDGRHYDAMSHMTRGRGQKRPYPPEGSGVMSVDPRVHASHDERRRMHGCYLVVSARRGFCNVKLAAAAAIR